MAKIRSSSSGAETWLVSHPQRHSHVQFHSSGDDEEARPKPAAQQPPVQCAPHSRPSASRGLTFVNCTLDEVLNAEVRDHPNIEQHEQFWNAVLAQKPDDKFRPLQNRTFSYWVECFNRWLLLRAGPGESPVRDMSIHGHELTRIFSLSKTSCKNIIELFDPEGHLHLNSGARTLQQIVIPMPQLATAGVLLSKLIPRRVKTRLLLGLFDLDDSGYLNEVQFTMFLCTFHKGLGAAFRVGAERTAGAAELRRRARELFQHAMAMSAPGHHDEARGLDYETLWEWWCGSLSDFDGLSLPYKLVVDRFAPTMGMDIADCFEVGIRDFRLSHSKPMRLKMERSACVKHGTNMSMCRYLPSDVVLAARAVFESAQGLEKWRAFGEQYTELEARLKDSALTSNDNLRRWLFRELQDLCRTDGQPPNFIAGVDFMSFLRKLCPCALIKHLRMFDNWCHQYDLQQQQLESAKTIGTCVNCFQRTEAKPVLPSADLRALRDEFAKLDTNGNGFLDVGEITSGWGWTREYATETFQTFDSSLDGAIDEDEFLRMMCPPEYKLPTMTGFGRELIGAIVVSEWQAVSEFRKSAHDAHHCIIHRKTGLNAESVPSAILPLAPEDHLEQWGAVWDDFNRSGGDLVTISDLEASGLLSREVCNMVVLVIDPERKEGFTREAFLCALCRARGYRPRFEDACALAHPSPTHRSGEGV